MLVLLACKRGREAFWLLWTGLGGWLLSIQLRTFFASSLSTAELINALDPVEGGSLPSGLMVFYFCYFGFLFFIAYEQLVPGSFARLMVLTLTAGLILLVPVSRVYLGDHQVADIPVSYVLGGSWLFVSVRLYRRWMRIHQRQRDWFLPYRATNI
jgi:undecaprenyl-diphosphatase